MKRLNFHNDERKRNHKGCRFWTRNQKNRSKTKDQIKENNYGKNNYQIRSFKSNPKKNILDNEFYGLSQNGKNKNKIFSKNKDNRIYQSKYAKINECKDESIEFKPTKMTTLVMNPKKENKDITSCSSDLEKDLMVQTNNNVKFERLDAINMLKIDEKNIKRNRRMFGFMIKHLRKAQKEHELKKNTTLKLIYIAKNLREKQKKFIQIKFKERQIEIYNKRTQQRKRKIKHLEWIYIHNENILLAIKMKSIFLNYCNLLNTKTEPIIFFRPKMNENELQKVFRKEMDSSSFRLRIILEKRLKIILETEGECPSDPDSLPFENSPYVFRFINKESKDKQKSLIEYNNGLYNNNFQRKNKSFRVKGLN